MARPRVIVADTDESYVIPLQKKFILVMSDRTAECTDWPRLAGCCGTD